MRFESDESFLIPGLVQPVDVVPEHGDMVPEDIVHKGGGRKAPPADFADNIQNRTFGLGTDIERCPDVVIRRNEERAFVVGQDDASSPPAVGRCARSRIFRSRRFRRGFGCRIRAGYSSSCSGSCASGGTATSRVMSVVWGTSPAIILRIISSSTSTLVLRAIVTGYRA